MHNHKSLPTLHTCGICSPSTPPADYMLCDQEDSTGVFFGTWGEMMDVIYSSHGAFTLTNLHTGSMSIYETR